MYAAAKLKFLTWGSLMRNTLNSPPEEESLKDPGELGIDEFI